MSSYDGSDGFDDYEPYEDEGEATPPARRRAPGGATPLGAGVAGLLIGALLAGIALAAIGGNPFSDANDVVYRDIVVADISVDRICWSTDPGRRDAQLDCAILSIDPTAAEPQEGERVTVGVVKLRPPGGQRATQVVYLRGSGPAAVEDEAEPESPADGTQPGGTEDDADADADA